MTKPSEHIVKAPYDGKDVIDSTGRVIKLKKPSLLDRYDLFKVLGEDAKVPECMNMAILVLHVAMIDGSLCSTPKTYGEVRAMLQRLDDHGLNAVAEELTKNMDLVSEKRRVIAQKNS